MTTRINENYKCMTYTNRQIHSEAAVAYLLHKYAGCYEAPKLLDVSMMHNGAEAGRGRCSGLVVETCSCFWLSLLVHVYYYGYL